MVVVVMIAFKTGVLMPAKWLINRRTGRRLPPNILYYPTSKG
jgi:hypothetical protein